jgi:hypothetical protein
MANKKTDNPLPTNAQRRFSKRGEGFTSFEQGESIRGKFLSVKEKAIRDRGTGESKTIRIYSIQTDKGVATIGSRTLLDDCFDEVCAYVGGWEKLVGKEVEFQRGKDVETDDYKEGKVENKLGTYDIILY